MRWTLNGAGVSALELGLIWTTISGIPMSITHGSEQRILIPLGQLVSDRFRPFWSCRSLYTRIDQLEYPLFDA